MAKRQRDCAVCGAPVGIIGRQLCCRCVRRQRERDAKQSCPDCGRDRVLVAATGRCMLCSRRCLECGLPVRRADATLCKTCRRRADLLARQQTCPRCGKPGYLRAETGWCGSCSRPGPPKDPPRICAVCGELRRHTGRGLCSRCWQRDPQRPFVHGEHLAARLEDPPVWFDQFIVHVAEVFSPARACNVLTALGRLLTDEHSNHPQALLDRSPRAGRSLGPLARSLEDFFTERGLAMPTAHAQRLAEQRRQRRVNAVPAALRPAVASYAESLLTARARARRAATLPRSDRTIDVALATVRDLALFLDHEQGKQDWSTVDIADIETFLNLQPDNRPRRLTVLRQFFRFARTRRLVLVDPTRGLSRKQSKGFRGGTLTVDQQRLLFRRWTTDPMVHPHEALTGMLSLLHGASPRELRLLRCDTIDDQKYTVRLDGRPLPVPLDPASWSVLTRCLAHRLSQRTRNPHVIVTKVTKTGREPASTAYLTHVLDKCGITPRTARSTRLVDLVNTMDPKLVAVAFGMHPEGAMIYLADHVDAARLPNA